MILQRKIRLLTQRLNSFNCYVAKSFIPKYASIPQFSSGSYKSNKINLENLTVPSRYKDVPLSQKSYFDFVWEHREKHLDKIAMVSDTFKICC